MILWKTIIWISNQLTMRVPDESYYRRASSAQN